MDNIMDALSAADKRNKVREAEAAKLEPPSQSALNKQFAEQVVALEKKATRKDHV